jgi:hypothetical protein
MRARTLIIGTVVGLWLAPLGIAAAPKTVSDEEAHLIARLNWQRTRIAQLQAEIRALGQEAPAATAVPGDEALRSGLSAEELRVARGEPDQVYHLNARCEIWSYGTTRVTLTSNRVTSWQSGSAHAGPTLVPAVTTAGDPSLADEERPLPRPHPSSGG